MPKATIKSKTGTIITVEGSQEEVSRIISAYEGTGGPQKPATTRAPKRTERKREGTADLVLGLRDGGFFDKPKGLGDISVALEEKGFLVPTTSLSGVVLGLVKRKELRRKKSEGRWTYGK